MKKPSTIFLLLLLMPVILIAQPVLSKNEFYYVGDIFAMVSCDPSTVTVGAPGANEVWDFSAVSHASAIATTTVMNDTSATFPTSNLMIILPNGSIEYVQENNTDSYINGMRDSATHETIYYSNYDKAKRPAAYNTPVSYELYPIDTYYVSIPATATNGRGSLIQSCDAYGTLILPTGTFNNVLRVKKVQNEVDTTGTVIESTNTISYLWFDSLHSAPLFELDSVISVSNNSQSAMYLAVPAAVKNVVASDPSYKAYLGNNGLLVTGDFIYGQAYDIDVYNLIGSKVLSYQFTATGNTQQFESGGQVSPGIYIVSILPKADPASRQVVKVVKQ